MSVKDRALGTVHMHLNWLVLPYYAAEEFQSYPTIFNKESFETSWILGYFRLYSR
jgi:hypothetical protein